MSSVAWKDGERVDDAAVLDPFGEVDERRLRIALTVVLYARGRTIESISRLFNVSRRTVYYDLREVDPEVGHRLLSLS